MKITRKSAAIAVLGGIMAFGGVAAASQRIVINPVGSVSFKCAGGMSTHGHTWTAGSNPADPDGDGPLPNPHPVGMSLFDGDPDVTIDVVFTVDEDFFRVEEISTGTHAGTHIDAPRHFLNEGRSLEELSADEFVWETYVIDVRERMQTEPVFQLSVDDIKNYERRNRRIARGSLVVFQTGFEEAFGTPAMFGPNPGMSAEAIQWLFDERHISGIGTDLYGPDAATDFDFLATYTVLANDGVAVVAMKNLDDLAIQGDLLMAPAVRLEEGSGFPVNPISCQGNRSQPRSGPSTVNLGADE